MLAVGLALYAALSDALAFFNLLNRGLLSTMVPVPVSLLVVFLLGWILVVCYARHHQQRRPRRIVIIASAALHIDATLISRDGHFREVPGLAWSSSLS